MRGCSLLAVHQNLILIAECSDFTQTSALLTVLISLSNAFFFFLSIDHLPHSLFQYLYSLIPYSALTLCQKMLKKENWKWPSFIQPCSKYLFIYLEIDT